MQIYRRIVRIASCCMSFLSNATQYRHEAFISSQNEHITADIVFPRVFKNYFRMSHPCLFPLVCSGLWQFLSFLICPDFSEDFRNVPPCVYGVSSLFPSGFLWWHLVLLKHVAVLYTRPRWCVSSDGYLMTWVSQCLRDFITEFPVVPLHTLSSERDLLKAERGNSSVPSPP